MKIVYSVNKVKIRLTNERYHHITNSHPEIQSSEEILKTVESPDVIIKGWNDELLAARRNIRDKNWLVVIYKENNNDGFVITAYITTDTRWLFKRKIIWKKD